MTSITAMIILIFSPLIASLLIASPLLNNEIIIRRFAKFFCIIHFLYTTILTTCFTTNKSIEISNNNEITWIKSLGINFSLGLDTLSIVLVLLTTFIFLLTVILSKLNIRSKHKLYYSMIFLLETAILGVFCARDIFLFFLFWEIELIPMYFLISQWGDKNSSKSAYKFVLYTFIGSLFMLAGLLMLHYYNFSASGILSGNMYTITSNNTQIPMQLLISILLLIGFGVKLPIFPLHTWLPDVHTEASTPVSILLAALLLKLGAYGILRFNLQILPDTFQIIVPVLSVLALINIIYGGFLAYAQTDIKRIIAYSSISNMGLILLGICALNEIGLSGALFHIIGHALIVTGLFSCAGIIYLRTKTRELNKLSGLAQYMPKLFGFTTVIILAAAGVPLFMGFIGEILNIIGFINADNTILIKTIAIIALTIMIWATCYLFKLLHTTFYTQSEFVPNYNVNNLKDISNHEFLVLFLTTSAIIIFGIYPNLILDILHNSDIFNLLTSKLW